MNQNPIPCTCKDFEVFLQGNQSGFAAANYNSFPDPMSKIFYILSNGTVSTTPTGTIKETVIEFYSGNGSTIGPTVTGNYGPSHASVPHFGITGQVQGQTTGGERLPPLQMEWDGDPNHNGSGLTTTKGTIEPTVGVNLTSGTTGALKYLVYQATSTANGVSTTNYYELPYQGTYKLSFVGSAGAVTLSGTQYFTSTTLIPLDQLNATGLAGNTWTLDPSNSGPVAATPLPAALPLFGSALGMIGLFCRRRKEKSVVEATGHERR
jgi:hypothetical protein